MSTPYDDYETYEFGEEWDYNDEMEALFEARVARGPVDDRPSSDDAPDDALWIATDQALIYRNDPSNGWVVTGHGSDDDRVPDAFVEALTVGDVDADTVEADSATVESSPSDDTDVARKVDLDDLDDVTADLTEEDGVLVSSQVPDLAITETYVVADEAERLDLDVGEGDIAIQEDEDETFIFTGGDPSDDGDWSQIEFPDAPVKSVFGREGDVSAESGDYTADQVGAVGDGDDVARDIYVIESGASDPGSAGDDDLIFEEEEG